MGSAFQEAQAEHDKAERESAERFWASLRLVRSTRAQAAEAWSIVNTDDERRGEVVMVWGEPHPYCVVVLDEEIEAGGWEEGVYRLREGDPLRGARGGWDLGLAKGGGGAELPPAPLGAPSQPVCAET